VELVKSSTAYRVSLNVTSVMEHKKNKLHAAVHATNVRDFQLPDLRCSVIDDDNDSDSPNC